MSSNVEEIVGAYVNIRAAREKLLRKFELEDGELKKDLSVLEEALLSVCNDMNANSINTNHGTVMRKLNERFYCNDWEIFKLFVKEHDALELFERRIHQGNFKSFLEDQKSEDLPPGINVMRSYGVVVRKSQESHNE